MFSAAVDSNRSAPRPAQSPTLSPTRSAINGWIARIVLGDARLDLPDEIGAHVCSFGVDAAAELGEERDEGGAEAVADDQEGNPREPLIRAHPRGGEACEQGEEPADPE